MLAPTVDIIGEEVLKYVPHATQTIEERLEAVVGLFIDANDSRDNEAIEVEFRYPPTNDYLIVELHPKWEFSYVNDNLMHIDDLLPCRIFVAGKPEQATAETLSTYHMIVMCYSGSDVALDDGTTQPLAEILNRIAAGNHIWDGWGWSDYRKVEEGDDI